MHGRMDRQAAIHMVLPGKAGGPISDTKITKFETAAQLLSHIYTDSYSHFYLEKIAADMKQSFGKHVFKLKGFL